MRGIFAQKDENALLAVECAVYALLAVLLNCLSKTPKQLLFISSDGSCNCAMGCQTPSRGKPAQLQGEFSADNRFAVAC